MNNYWEIEHKENWHKGIDGSIQTAMLCGAVLSNLSIRQYEKLFDAQHLIDIGCACGEAAKLFDGLLRNTSVYANDISTAALNQVDNSQVTILQKDFREIQTKFDVVYCSQLPAFYKDDLLTDLVKLTNHMLIVVVPYDQNLEGRVTEPIDGHEPGGHKRAFSRKDFPKFIGGLERTTFKLMPITNQKILGSQLLVVYERLDAQTVADIQFEQQQLEDYYMYLENR